MVKRRRRRQRFAGYGGDCDAGNLSGKKSKRFELIEEDGVQRMKREGRARRLLLFQEQERKGGFFFLLHMCK